jgi:pimeloyl-ACP methyl ester carboxylesterase
LRRDSKMNAMALVFLILVAASPGIAADSGGSKIIEGVVSTPDGLEVVYDVRGEGDPTLLFVHCWSCDRSFWHNQVDLFAADYRIVTLDLPGHGESGRNREEWSIAGLALDVQAVIEHLDLQNVILVGHSMGGPVSVETARLLPDRIIGIICVDTLHNLEMEYTDEMMKPFVDRFEEDFKGTMRWFFSSIAAEGADSTTVQWILDKALAADKQVAVALMRDFPNLGLKERVAELSIPIRCINAAPNPPAAPVTEIETNQKYGDFDATLVEGVGHFIQLENPELFNEELRSVLRELAHR